MKRLIVALLVAGVLFGTMLVLNTALPSADETAGSGSSSDGSGWNGISLMGAP